MFIVIDGPDFTGKSTAIKKLAEVLTDRHVYPVICNDPNTSLPISSKLRSMVLNGVNDRSKEEETLCFLVARAELNQKIIKPAMSKNRMILCDRYVSSTIAYQVFGRQYSHDMLPLICDTKYTLRSDLTFILTVDDEHRVTRMKSRGNDIDEFDKLGNDFRSRVKHGYDFCIANTELLNTDNVIEIDTSGISSDTVVDIMLHHLDNTPAV